MYKAGELVLVLILLVFLLLLLCDDVFIYTDYQGFLCLLMSVCLGFLFSFFFNTDKWWKISHIIFWLMDCVCFCFCPRFLVYICPFPSCGFLLWSPNVSPLCVISLPVSCLSCVFSLYVFPFSSISLSVLEALCYVCFFLPLHFSRG